MLRDRSNCTLILVEPSELVEVSSVTPAISPMRRSKGAATVVAITEGSAPGSCAETLIVGRSTVGRLATGKRK